MYPFTPRPPEAVVGVDDICDCRSNRKLNQEARPLILNIEVETTERAEGYNLHVFHCFVYIYIYISLETPAFNGLSFLLTLAVSPQFFFLTLRLPSFRWFVSCLIDLTVMGH